jgi:trehalose 6-phosphate synthase
MAHFIHIPWPQTDYWHVLPGSIRREIHEGLLANDVIGFHTERWRLNFLRAASDVADASCDFAEGTAAFGDHRSLVTVHPISVDPSEFDEAAGTDEVLVAERELEARRPEKLVLRVDRTDPSKNIVRGFRAFEVYLDAHPEMHRRVGMLARLDPSRQDIPEYAEYLGAIQREARRVNDRFQQEGWIPIELVIEDNFAASVAAYKQFDVLFVNAIFDGMNLVAKEAPLVNERDGVLILSENAGAHSELGDWALTVNPFDVAGQAEALDRALTMPEGERRERLGAICEHVREHDVADWIEGQLADLDRFSASVT